MCDMESTVANRKLPSSEYRCAIHKIYSTWLFFVSSSASILGRIVPRECCKECTLHLQQGRRDPQGFSSVSIRPGLGPELGLRFFLAFLIFLVYPHLFLFLGNAVPPVSQGNPRSPQYLSAIPVLYILRYIAYNLTQFSGNAIPSTTTNAVRHWEDMNSYDLGCKTCLSEAFFIRMRHNTILF